MLLSSYISGLPVPMDASAFTAGLALAHTCGKRGDAPAILEEALRAYWHVLSPETEIRSPFRAAKAPLPAEAADLAWRFGTAAALFPVDEACDLLGRLHSTALPPKLRAQQGSYYTPPGLAGLLARRATEAGTDWTRARILDPACGGGATLLPALRHVLAALPGRAPCEVLDQVAGRLRGVDLDPGAAWLAQVMLDAALLPWTRRAARPAPQVVEVADSLHGTIEDGAWDLVLGNPPYGAVTISPEDRARFSDSLHGRANLYGLFLHRAVDLVRPGGIITFLLPTTCLGGEYSRALRGLLGRQAPPASLDFLVDRAGVYDSVQQETMLGVWVRGAPAGEVALTEIRMKDGRPELHPIGRMPLPAELEAPWPLPRRRSEAHLATVLARASHRLADWGYRVRTGPAEAPRLKGRLAATPGPGRVPLLWAEAVGSGSGLAWPGTRRASTAWLDATDRTALLVRQPALLVQRTTAPEQSRRLVTRLLPADFLAAHGGAVAVENHLNLVEPVCAAPSVPVEVVAAFLGSAAADAAFRCLGSSLAVSAAELRALPLPPAQKLGALAGLIAAGANAEAVERECLRLYEMT